MVGTTKEKGIRYLSHEKSNYGPTGDTVLFSIQDGKIQFEGNSDKKDREFVSENAYEVNQKPQRNEAKEFILEYLQDGEKLTSDLDAAANAMSISKITLQRAKADLKKEGRIKYRSEGFKEKKFYCSLVKVSSYTQ